MIENILKYLF